MKFLTLSLFILPGIAQAFPSQTECSPCGSYGSPFGPDNGYSFYCYFVKVGESSKAFSFGSDRDACLRSWQTNALCAGSSGNPISEPKEGDPCWKQ